MLVPLLGPLLGPLLNPRRSSGGAKRSGTSQVKTNITRYGSASEGSRTSSWSSRAQRGAARLPRANQPCSALLSLSGMRRLVTHEPRPVVNTPRVKVDCQAQQTARGTDVSSLTSIGRYIFETWERGSLFPSLPMYLATLVVHRQSSIGCKQKLKI